MWQQIFMALGAGVASAVLFVVPAKGFALAIALGVIGIIVAAGHVWAFFIQWLTLLGILVPPIGAIILIDQYFLRTNAKAEADWRPVAFLAWIIGSVAGVIVEFQMPGLSTALCSAIVAGVVYLIAAKASGATEKAPGVA